ncbi:MAG: oxygen-independent coproporphyrinogen-3 oxidase [Bacteroidia bacterium]|jgi:oxygen-independent coproporphyrinogen-3 oxidase
MAGIYIHIPFCRKACTYCDFHFTTNLTSVQDLVDSICMEIDIQKGYLDQSELTSIYFGGGTPSLLSESQLNQILESIHAKHAVNSKAEITLEANPDDLTSEKLITLHSSGVNRLSIGIQSLNDDLLKWMNRSHDRQQALGSISEAQSIGIENISVDLIFGTNFPDRDLATELEEFLRLDVPHISAYSLTVEPGTLLNNLIEKGEEFPMNPEHAANEFLQCHDALTAVGFNHYEVSNYAKPSNKAKHNSSYWESQSYLGIGPSAHSFNGSTRQWNVKSNAKYIQELSNGKIPCELESLDQTAKLNELLMTGLRTSSGVSRNNIIELSSDNHWNQLKKACASHAISGSVVIEKDRIVCTTNGWLILDHILSDLFFE